MLIQLLPLPIGGLSGSIRQSAASALDMPLSSSVSIDPGLTLIALSRLASMHTVAPSLPLHRRSDRVVATLLALFWFHLEVAERKREASEARDASKMLMAVPRWGVCGYLALSVVVWHNFYELHVPTIRGDVAVILFYLQGKASAIALYATAAALRFSLSGCAFA
jgi:hypothetical protein